MRIVTNLPVEIVMHDRQNNGSHFHDKQVYHSYPVFVLDQHDENIFEMHFQYGHHPGKTAKYGIIFFPILLFSWPKV